MKKIFAGGGDGDFELSAEYRSGDLAVLVGVERQNGPVGGFPDQEWPLRVTLVFRREDSDCRPAHRQADALVHPISMEHLSLLASGSVGSERTGATAVAQSAARCEDFRVVLVPGDDPPFVTMILPQGAPQVRLRLREGRELIRRLEED